MSANFCFDYLILRGKIKKGGEKFDDKETTAISKK
jgi:hypothetical protein